MAALTLDQQSNTLRLLDLLHKCKLLLSKRVLVHQSRIPKHVRREVIHRILCNTAAAQLQTLHVPSLGATQRKDAVLGEHVQRERVDTLLVEDDKVLWLAGFPVCRRRRVGRCIAYSLLELDNLLESRIDESAFRLDELLALLGGRVKETRVDLAA